MDNERYCIDDYMDEQELEDCQHDNVETVWERIPGEVCQQPAYDRCVDCGEIV